MQKVIKNSQRGECCQPKPFKVMLKKDKDYFYCACGKSKNQPFCDGSHSGSKFKPIKITGTGQQVYLCGCRQSNNPKGQAYCDGTHLKIDW